MTEHFELPPGWKASAWPADWNPRDAEGPAELKLERVGYVLLPERFYLLIQSPEMVEASHESEAVRALSMFFAVEDDDLVLRALHGVNVDLLRHAAHLFAEFSPEKWKPLAVSEITQFLAFEDRRRAAPPGVSTAQLRAEMDISLAFGDHGKQGGSDEGQKRHRITPEHLRVVAGIYAEAKETGKPPTRAVQEHFNVSHSTAAKWVGAARKLHILPPATPGTSSIPGLMTPEYVSSFKPEA